LNCSTRLYHSNEFGFSRECTCQQAVHVAFGTVSLLLSHFQLENLAAYITETLAVECRLNDHNERCIYIPTRDSSLMFVMTYNELRQLSEILDQTQIMLQIDEALNDNN
jgi:hypothetical protein